MSSAITNGANGPTIFSISLLLGLYALYSLSVRAVLMSNEIESSETALSLSLLSTLCRDFKIPFSDAFSCNSSRDIIVIIKGSANNNMADTRNSVPVR